MSMLPEEDIRQQNMVGWKAAVTAPTCWCRILEDWKRGPVDHVTALDESSPFGQTVGEPLRSAEPRVPIGGTRTAYPPETGWR